MRLLYVCTGHETTATTTAAALYCISAHPAVEQQLLGELQSVLGDRPPTYEDLEHLPYLQASVPAGLGWAALGWAANRPTLMHGGMISMAVLHRSK